MEINLIKHCMDILKVLFIIKNPFLSIRLSVRLVVIEVFKDSF